MQKLIKNISISSLFLALAIILPVYFHAIAPEIASSISPIHIPVLVLGLILGPIYGGIVGFIAPLLAFVVNGRPPVYPMGISMAFECLVYGVVSGLLYKNIKLFKKDIINLYFSLISSMLIGRIVYGLFSAFLTLAFNANSFKGIKAWAISMFVTGLIGIIIHLILVPTVVIAIKRFKEVDE